MATVGFSVPNASEISGRSESTVKRYRGIAYDTFHTDNVGAMARSVFENGLLTVDQPFDNEAFKLWPRQSQTLDLASRGYTVEESADLLGVRYSTVKTHMSRVAEQLGTPSKAAAIFVGIVSGQIELNRPTLPGL